jgi:GT2 family glycosyltransferase
VVKKKGLDLTKLQEAGLIDECFDEPASDVASAINLGISAMPSDIRFVSWLGDDDLLSDNSLTKSLARITAADNPVMVYGSCDYIDHLGRKIFTMKSGSWAVPLMRFGPDLIPQPGSLFSREAFEKVGGLKSAFGWAFDFELFLSLNKLGKLSFLPNVLSSFRWHPGSLSVLGRRASVNEASAVRKAHLPKMLRPISELWEWPVREATYFAGIRVSKKLKK